MRPSLIIMTKAPVAGRVKTRLARAIGTARATCVFRHVQQTAILRLSRDPRWRTILAITPDTALASPMFPKGMLRRCQGDGDLGMRMQRLFDIAPLGPAVIVGTDIPGVKPADIAAAFAALGNHDAVFAPAQDGGYWLVGLKRFPRTPRPFAHVRWSSADALADTLANLAGLRCARLRTEHDLDTAEDLAHLRRLIGRRILPLS